MLIPGRPSATSQVLVIRPVRGWRAINLREILGQHELIFFLAWREIAVRYKQTVLGVAWAVMQPVMAMTVFSLVFGRLAGMPSDGVPYPLFAYCGLLPWQLFAYSLTESSNSLVANQNLLTKVYFPRLVIPISVVLASLVDFSIAGALLALFMVYYDAALTPAVFLLPGFVLMAIGLSLGVGLWLSALNIRYRDVRYVVPFLTQFWLFATPVVYPASLVPARWQALYGLNPMAGVVEGFRWALLGTPPPSGSLLLVSICVTVLLLVTGALYFRRTEATFADTV